MRINCLIPSRGRAAVLDRCLAAIAANTDSQGAEVKVFVMHDGDDMPDEEKKAYRDVVAGHGATLLGPRPRKGWGKSLNEMAELEPADVYWCGSDEIQIITPKWNCYIEGIFMEHGELPALVCRPPFSGVPFFNEAWRKFFGRLVYPEYDHWVVDLHFVQVARDSGSFFESHEVQLAFDQQNDETGRIGLASMEHDNAAWAILRSTVVVEETNALRRFRAERGVS